MDSLVESETRMNPQGQVAPQALLENVFENQELVDFGVILVAKPVRDPHF